MKRLLFVMILFLPYLCHSQKRKSEYLPHKQKADSMMMYFFGAAYRYVQLDSSKSLYRLPEGSRTRKTAFDSPVGFVPSFFTFYYVFRHPALSGETFRISFTLDTLKHFVPDSTAYGFVDASGLVDSLVVSRKQALYHSQNSIKGSIKGSTITLAWYTDDQRYDQYNRTKNIRDIPLGRMVWEVKATEKFRGESYDGKVAVDVITGDVFRIFAIPWD